MKKCPATTIKRVDLDIEERTFNMNGYNHQGEDDEEDDEGIEADHRDTESVDLDTPVQNRHVKPDRLGPSISFSARSPPKVNGHKHSPKGPVYEQRLQHVRY
jgi:hypothetical protein